MIIVMFHVFGGHFGSNVGFNDGCIAVFMYAAAILAVILHILISPRVPEWNEPDYE